MRFHVFKYSCWNFSCGLDQGQLFLCLLLAASQRPQLDIWTQEAYLHSFISCPHSITWILIAEQLNSKDPNSTNWNMILFFIFLLLFFSIRRVSPWYYTQQDYSPEHMHSQHACASRQIRGGSRTRDMTHSYHYAISLVGRLTSSCFDPYGGTCQQISELV